MKIFLASLALVLAPLSAYAEGCSHESASQCADGQVWDSVSQSCIAQTTS